MNKRGVLTRDTSGPWNSQSTKTRIQIYHALLLNKNVSMFHISKYFIDFILHFVAYLKKAQLEVCFHIKFTFEWLHLIRAVSLLLMGLPPGAQQYRSSSSLNSLMSPIKASIPPSPCKLLQVAWEVLQCVSFLHCQSNVRNSGPIYDCLITF